MVRGDDAGMEKGPRAGWGDRGPDGKVNQRGVGGKNEILWLARKGARSRVLGSQGESQRGTEKENWKGPVREERRSHTQRNSQPGTIRFLFFLELKVFARAAR